MITELWLSVILVAISVIWMYIGIFQLGIWVPGVKASSGLIPTIFATLTLIFSIVMLVSAVKAIRNKKQAQQSKEITETEKNAKKAEKLTKLSAYVPVLFTFIGILIFQYFGVVIFSFLMTFIWLLVISKKGWKKSLVTACVVTLFIYLVFDLWLSIPFPGQILKL